MDNIFEYEHITSKLSSSEESFVKKSVEDFVDGFIKKSNQSRNRSLAGVNILGDNAFQKLLRISHNLRIEFDEWNTQINSLITQEITTVSEALHYVKMNGIFIALIPPKLQTKSVCEAAIKNNPMSIRFVTNQTKELCLLAVTANPGTLLHINNKDQDIIMAAIMNGNGSEIKYLNQTQQTFEVCKAAMEKNAFNFIHIIPSQRSTELCTMAILKNPSMIRHVPKQTPELVELALIVSNYEMFNYVTEKTPEMCRKAIIANPFNISYIDNQTEKLCVLAVSLNPATIDYVKNITKKVFVAALMSMKKGDLLVKKNGFTNDIERMIFRRAGYKR